MGFKIFMLLLVVFILLVPGLVFAVGKYCCDCSEPGYTTELCKIYYFGETDCTCYDLDGFPHGIAGTVFSYDYYLCEDSDFDGVKDKCGGPYYAGALANSPWPKFGGGITNTGNVQTPYEACNDNLDNDNDGLVDCFDGDCFGFDACTHIKADVRLQLYVNGVERSRPIKDGNVIDLVRSVSSPDVNNEIWYVINASESEGVSLEYRITEQSEVIYQHHFVPEKEFIMVDDPDAVNHIVKVSIPSGAFEEISFTFNFVRENCYKNEDYDEDGLNGCNDGDCVVSPACVWEICNDNLDNDWDGKIDCADSDCFGRTAQDCIDLGLNNLECLCDPFNNNLLFEVDCSDGVNQDCYNWVDNIPCGGVAETDCTCEIFPDFDPEGLIDCGDPDCSDDTACSVEVCNNFKDDDGDELRECADDDCALFPLCDPAAGVAGGETICDDDIDNDNDNGIDCGDPDCGDDPLCTGEVVPEIVPEICDNEIDDDDDGLVDCNDGDCVSDPLCIDLCNVDQDPSVVFGNNVEDSYCAARVLSENPNAQFDIDKNCMFVHKGIPVVYFPGVPGAEAHYEFVDISGDDVVASNDWIGMCGGYLGTVESEIFTNLWILLTETGDIMAPNHADQAKSCIDFSPTNFSFYKAECVDDYKNLIEQVEVTPPVIPSDGGLAPLKTCIELGGMKCNYNEDCFSCVEDAECESVEFSTSAKDTTRCCVADNNPVCVEGVYNPLAGEVTYTYKGPCIGGVRNIYDKNYNAIDTEPCVDYTKIADEQGVLNFIALSSILFAMFILVVFYIGKNKSSKNRT